MRKLLFICAIAVLPVFKVSAQTIIPVKDAAKYAGKKITTCDKVFSTKIDKGNIILYLGGDSPDQPETFAMIALTFAVCRLKVSARN